MIFLKVLKKVGKGWEFKKIGFLLCFLFGFLGFLFFPYDLFRNSLPDKGYQRLGRLERLLFSIIYYYLLLTDHLFTFISLLLFLFIFPIILLQTFKSWILSSNILSEGDKIPYEK